MSLCIGEMNKADLHVAVFAAVFGERGIEKIVADVGSCRKGIFGGDLRFFQSLQNFFVVIGIKKSFSFTINDGMLTGRLC